MILMHPFAFNSRSIALRIVFPSFTVPMRVSFTRISMRAVAGLLLIVIVVFMMSLSLWLAYVYNYTLSTEEHNPKPNISTTVTNL